MVVWGKFSQHEGISVKKQVNTYTNSLMTIVYNTTQCKARSNILISINRETVAVVTSHKMTEAALQDFETKKHHQVVPIPCVKSAIP